MLHGAVAPRTDQPRCAAAGSPARGQDNGAHAAARVWVRQLTSRVTQVWRVLALALSACGVRVAHSRLDPAVFTLPQLMGDATPDGAFRDGVLSALLRRRGAALERAGEDAGSTVHSRTPLSRVRTMATHDVEWQAHMAPPAPGIRLAVRPPGGHRAGAGVGAGMGAGEAPVRGKCEWLVFDGAVAADWQAALLPCAGAHSQVRARPLCCLQSPLCSRVCVSGLAERDAGGRHAAVGSNGFVAADRNHVAGARIPRNAGRLSAAARQ